MNERGFYLVTTLDRFEDLRKCLTTLRLYNKYPFIIAVALDEVDAYRKKIEICINSPFDTTIYLDTDTMIMGNLDEMFKIGERGYFAIYREKLVNVYNAGVFVLPKHLKKFLLDHWLPRYEDKKVKWYQCKEQDALNSPLPNLPVYILTNKYNCLLQDITPEEELKTFDQIKIFHFLHNQNVNKELYKSYQLWKKL